MAARNETAERVRNAPRIDMRPKVTGSAKYIEDLPEPEGLLYGAVLSEPLSHARIVSIDSSKADNMPGVIGVLYRDRLGDFHPTSSPAAKRAFQADSRSAVHGD